MSRKAPLDSRPPADAALQEFAQALELEMDSRKFRPVALDRLSNLTAATTSWLLESAQDRYVTTEVRGDLASSNPLSLPGRGALARWLRVNDEPLIVPMRPEILAYLPEPERRVLTEHRVEICVPLVVGRELVGIVLLAGATLPVPVGHANRLRTAGRLLAAARHRVTQLDDERERLASAARAQQLAMAGQLAAAMAHEVRNPLTTIRSSVQYVMGSTSEWSAKLDLLSQVVDEVDRINRSISGVLGLSRPHPDEVSQIDLVDLVERTLMLFEPHCRHQRVTVDRNLLVRPLAIRGDAGELRQVLLNVLLNACQSMPDGGTIRIATNATSSPAPAAVVTIADSGIGMAAGDLRNAFDPFFTTKASGTGLGLAICRQIVVRHRGDIHLASELSHGTTVTLTLPLTVA